MECIWVSIFFGFWCILEGNLGRKIQLNRYGWRGMAWRGVMARRGEAWCGEAWRGVAWQGVKAWQGGLARPWPEGPNGLALLKGVDLPRAPDPGGRATSERLISILWPSWCFPFFDRFFDAFLDRSWLHFPSQLGLQNPPKSIKNLFKFEVQDGKPIGTDF